MNQLSTILFNSSQPVTSVTKDDILDSIKRMIKDYNNVVDSEDKINITDFRNK